MYCNRDGRLTELSEGENRRCAYEKCGGWRYVGPGFTKYFSKSGGITGAWLPAATVCRAGLYSEGRASSSSSYTDYILENLELFRGYSEDPALVDSYFDEGVYFNLVDLDGASSSASMLSSGPFLLTVDLSRRSSWLGALPTDYVWYVYDEEVGGSPAPGLVSVERKGDYTLEVSLSPGHVPDGSTEFSFRLNVEHPDLAPSRTKFVFRRDEQYSSGVEVFEWQSGRRGRLTEEYRQYLRDWIADFWAAFDAGDESLVPPLVTPFPDSFVPFDPFAHARWRLRGHLGMQGGVSAMAAGNPNNVPFSSGNGEMVEGQNFLGVAPEVWSCVSKDLYKFYGYQDNFSYLGANAKWNPRWPKTGQKGYKDPDVSFDCRSFALLGAKYLRDQLSSVCPNAVVSVAGINGHYLVHVDLAGKGAATDCCKGQFLWEPQGGETYESLEDYCLSDPDLCASGKPLTLYGAGKENSDDDFGDPNWESDEKEVERIRDVICGCLPGPYEPDTNEAYLKGLCDGGKMTGWVEGDMSAKAGGQPSMAIPEQKVECKLCVMRWDATWLCELGDWNLGFLPEAECMTEKQMDEVEFDVWKDAPAAFNSECKKIMYKKASSPLACGGPNDCGEARLSAKKPDPPGTGRPANCCGAWCTGEKSCDEVLYLDGGCEEGTLSSWKIADEAGVAGEYQDGKTCGDLNCQKEVPPPCECVYSWLAKYDCQKGEWEFFGGDEADYYCGKSQRVNNTWVVDEVGETPFDGCWRIYEFVGSGDCSADQDCKASRPGKSERPPLPSSDPTNCCPGAWCTGEFGCDGKFYTLGCDEGTLDQWKTGDDQKKVQNFQKGKTCADITCTVETLPKCGAWCAGEFGCDGKFYVLGCDEGTLDQWKTGDDQKKVQGFQEGKTCADITCAAETLPDCDKYYTFAAEYDCTTLSWGVSSTSSQQDHAPGSTLDQWVVEGCSATYRDSANYISEPAPSPPADPAFPTECCTVPLSGSVVLSSYGDTCCCSPCPTLSSPPDQCRCPKASLGSADGFVVAPLDAQRLDPSLTGGTNTVEAITSTGTMTDRLSIDANGSLLIDSPQFAGGVAINGAYSAEAPAGTNSLDIYLEKCHFINGSQNYLVDSGPNGCYQGTDLVVRAAWDLLVYVENPPLSGGVNTLPPDSNVDVLLG